MGANQPNPAAYRGRIAPSPTGYLHLGHAQTFWTAQERARAANGILVLRNDDLDRARCKPEFVRAMFEDLAWFGFEWNEGPDIGGPFAPYSQSERFERYRAAFERLRAGGFVYPCKCSRRDVEAAVGAPHAVDDEPIYTGTCRPIETAGTPLLDSTRASRPSSWRFRVPDGEVISFTDLRMGQQSFVAGKDFGDFVVWRPDHVPAYQLACVVDDAEMQITEVVRGEDLLVSSARQLLLYRALGLTPPRFYHCPLLRDERGVRLAKRHDALSLRAPRNNGISPEELRQRGSFMRSRPNPVSEMHLPITDEQGDRRRRRHRRLQAP